MNCAKCFLEVNKNSARKFVLIKCIFDTINKIYNDIGSGKILPKTKLFAIFCSVKNFINLLCINFSSILSILDRREIGLQLEHSSLEFFLWIGITSATFNFTANTPVANDVLKMTERCSDISFVRIYHSVRIWKRMQFGPVDILGLKFDIFSIIFSFVRGEMKNESWLGSDKYSKGLLHQNGTPDRTSAATEQKKLLKVFAIVRGSVTVWTSRLIIFGESFFVFWRKIKDLILFQVFFMLLILSLKYLSQ